MGFAFPLRGYDRENDDSKGNHNGQRKRYET